MLRRAVSRSGVQATSVRFFSAAAADKKYDLVVIGGGPGGYVAAIKAGQLGMKVACVEMRGALGGTCLNVGCIPSKALLNATHHYQMAKEHFKSFGIEGGENVTMNHELLMKSKEKAVTGLTKGIEGLFKKNKVDYIIGKGKITAKGKIVVDLKAGGQQVVNADKILVATGSAPAQVPNVPVDEETIVTSTGALSLKKVPKELVIIGGGVIGLELGSVYQRLGSKVTVIEYHDRIAHSLDSEIGAAFQRSLAKQKFNFIFSQRVESAVKDANGIVTVNLAAVSDPNKKTQVTADCVLISTGRRPYTEGLGVEELGIATERGQIKINSNFESSVPGIYAIGDVVAGPMLAHKAEEEGIAAVEIMAGKHGHVNYNAIPGVIYTHPEVATVGRTEEELKKANVEYRVGKFPFMANSRARTNDDSEGLVKIITDKKTDKILGAHIIGPNAGELLAELVLAMEYGAASEDVARTCHSHPTLSEAIKEACMAAYDKPIHI